MEHVGMIQEAENLVKIGRFDEAFEKFMAVESGGYEASFLRPCQMALANQLQQPQLQELFEVLEKEIGRDNPHAIFNYGCVKAHLKDFPKARIILMKAKQLGVSRAEEILRSL